jgi:hypothetical protein
MPVNYALRFRGLMTSSPPTVSGMVSESPNLPAQSYASCKRLLVPRRFSLQPSRRFSLYHFELGSSYLDELRLHS